MLAKTGAGLVAVAVAACSLGFDDENYQGQPGGSGATQPNPCSDGALASPEIPAGWKGPVLLVHAADESALPLCAGTQTIVYGDLEFEPLGCTCECDMPDPTEVCQATVTAYTTDDCSGNGFAQTVQSNCTSIPTSLVSSGIWEPAPANLGACTPNAPQPNHVVGWGTATLLCAAQADAIDGGLCVDPQAGFESRVCVYASDQSECPIDFPTALERYASFADNRACGTCQCDVGTLACSGTVDIFSNSDCTDQLLSVAPNVCVTLLDPKYGKYKPSFSGMCGKQQQPETGSVTPTDAVRVCCTS